METRYVSLDGLNPKLLFTEDRRTAVLICLVVHGRPSLRTANCDNLAIENLDDARAAFVEVAEYLDSQNHLIIKAQLAIGTYETDEVPDLRDWIRFESAAFMAGVCGISVGEALEEMDRSPIHHQADELKQNWGNN